MSDLTTPEGRLDILNRETFPWSPEASTMACQTIRGLLQELERLQRLPHVRIIPDGSEFDGTSYAVSGGNAGHFTEGPPTHVRVGTPASDRRAHDKYDTELPEG